MFAFAFVFAFVFAFAWVSSNSHTSVELSTWQARLLLWLGGVTFILKAIHWLGDRPRPVCKQLFVFVFVFVFAFDLSSRCFSGLMELHHLGGARKTLIEI